MFGKRPPFLPIEDVTVYKITSLVLYVLFVVGLVYGIMSFLFPYNRYSFDFNNPDATKNTLFALHLKDFSSIENGKIPPQDSFFFFANNWHILESGKIELRPREPHMNLEGQKISLQHGWAATFTPEGEQLLTNPAKTVVEHQGNYYELQGTTLLPFVSERAALSHVPKSAVQSLSQEQFNRFSQGDELLGFRIGTLISYVDGVFVVSEGGVVRPFGSPRILLRLGYSFTHVIPADALEFGIYKRGKIILPGQIHPSGTLFQDVDTNEVFIYQENTLSVLDTTYAEFLKTSNDIVLFSRKESERSTTCVLQKEFLQKSYSCELDIDFSQGRGDDYQVIFENGNQMIDLHTVTVGLQASRKKENAQYVSVLLVNRILERFGISRE